MYTARFRHVAGALVVTPRPADDRCRSGRRGRGWERSPISACLDRHRGGWPCTYPSFPALRGRSHPAVLAGSPSAEPRRNRFPDLSASAASTAQIGCRPTARRRVPCQTRGAAVSRLTSEPRHSVHNRRPYRAVDARFGANLLRAYGRLYISSAPSGSFAESGS